MKVSLNWLNDFVDIDITTAELAEKLVSAGFEVEDIIQQNSKMKNVVLGKIVGLDKHPDAEKLQICKIDIGVEIVQIITGAQNVSIGDLVPTALHNSLLPTGQEIKKGKLRGLESFGMLCSGQELCLSEVDYIGASCDGIMLMNHETMPLGTDLNIVLGNDDTILDISVTANRSDCNSILGIAREVSTILKKPLKMPKINFNTIDKKVSDFVTVEVKDTELCPRYMAGAVTDVKICPSDKLIQKRLKAVGLRPIDSIVDITNYVLIEIGQPMHAFDKNILEGDKIIVRRANESEKIIALDGKEYTMNSKMLAICDSQKACAIAGIMGGENSKINLDTKTVIFESAKFLRDNIRKTSRELNLRSDSSFRFERGIDFESQRLGLLRAMTLIYNYGYGKIAQEFIDILNADLTQNKIVTTTDKINDILGITVPSQVMVDILNSLQINTTLNGNELTCIQPNFRDDIENANDLAEEIIRLYGYDHIICTLMDKGKQTIGGKTQAQKNIDIIKEIAVSQGASEILTYSFTTPKYFELLRMSENDKLRDSIRLLNPLGEDFSIMRTTLAHNMLSALASNYLKSVKQAKLFEIANVYLPKAMPVVEQPNEIPFLVFGSYGNQDFYKLKGIVEVVLEKFAINFRLERPSSDELSHMHSGRTAKILCGNDVIGYFGEVHPIVASNYDVKEKMFIAELNLDSVNNMADFSYKFKEISKYPSMERDIAIVVDEKVEAITILDTIKNAGGNILQQCYIFDIYRNASLGDNKKSVAINLRFTLLDRSLLEEEVNAKMNRILTKLITTLGASLR